MSVDLSALLREVAGLDVAVVGDALLDVFVDGAPRGLCREAPVPVVAVQRCTESPGGAGNTAANVAALGGRPWLVSALGRDDAGIRLRDAMARCSVSTLGVRDADGMTVVKRRVMVGGHLLVRLDEGTDRNERPRETLLGTALTDAVQGASALVVSDYEYGLLSTDVRGELAQAFAAVPVTVVDAKSPNRYRLLEPTAATPNYAEAVHMLDLPIVDRDADRVSQLMGRGDELQSATGARMVAVTLGRAGALLFEPGRPPYRANIADPTPHDVIGAGDVFAAALSLALGRGADAPVAVEFATQAAAAAAAGSLGVTAQCTRQMLAIRLRAGDKELRGEDVPQWAESIRRTGARIVFTNGCFDLLHEGHIAFLSQAKALGDKLIVAVNDDDSVRDLKGPGRPVTGLAGRILVLSALSCVDHVVTFSGPSPVDLIEAVLPDVYVKGGDYGLVGLPELPVLQRLGVDVRILDYLADRSTSRIIEHVRSQV